VEIAEKRARSCSALALVRICAVAIPRHQSGRRRIFAYRFVSGK